MKRRFVALSLMVVMIYLQSPQAVAQAVGGQKEEIQNFYGKLSDIGTGEKARVVVEMKDKSRIQGYVLAVTDDGFVVRDKVTNKDEKVAFSNVNSIHKDGKRHLVKWIIVGAAGFLIAGFCLPLGK